MFPLFFYKEPEESRILNNLEHYRNELQKLDVGKRRGDTGTIDDAELYQKIRKEGSVGSETEATNKRNYLQNYEKLCRGEVRRMVRFALAFVNRLFGILLSRENAIKLCYILP